MIGDHILLRRAPHLLLVVGCQVGVSLATKLD